MNNRTTRWGGDFGCLPPYGLPSPSAPHPRFLPSHYPRLFVSKHHRGAPVPGAVTPGMGVRAGGEQGQLAVRPHSRGNKTHSAFPHRLPLAVRRLGRSSAGARPCARWAGLGQAGPSGAGRGGRSRGAGGAVPVPAEPPPPPARSRPASAAARRGAARHGGAALPAARRLLPRGRGHEPPARRLPRPPALLSPRRGAGTR